VLNSICNILSWESLLTQGSNTRSHWCWQVIRGSNFAQISKCSECNEISAIALSRLPDSGGIFTLSNGLRMEKISRSVRQAKQAKKILMLTVQSVQSVQSVRSDVAGPYRPYDDVSGGDVAGIDWLTSCRIRR
jgi:hypothetical protein